MASYKCCLCDSDRTELYCESDKMFQCEKCKIVFLSPEQTPKDLESYYENNSFYAENSKDLNLVRQMVKTARFYLKTITKYIDPVGKSLIDVGSNYGILVEESSRMGFTAIGLEKNKALVLAGRERGLNILTNDLSELDQTSDVITAMHVLEHLTKPRNFIKEAYQTLSPNGILAIGVPNINSYLAKKDGLSWRYVALEHLFYFSPDTLVALLKQEGFEILRIKQDASNLDDLSIRKLLHYLVGKAEVRDRFQAKTWAGRKTQVSAPKSLLKSILKKSLIVAIKILRREDFVLVIARKEDGAK